MGKSCWLWKQQDLNSHPNAYIKVRHDHGYLQHWSWGRSQVDPGSLSVNQHGLKGMLQVQSNVDCDREDTWYILLASTCLHMVHTHAHTYHTIHAPCMVFNFVSILFLTLWLCWISNCIFELLMFCSSPVTGKSISHNQLLFQLHFKL